MADITFKRTGIESNRDYGKPIYYGYIQWLIYKAFLEQEYEFWKLYMGFK